MYKRMQLTARCRRAACTQAANANKHETGRLPGPDPNGHPSVESFREACASAGVLAQRWPCRAARYGAQGGNLLETRQTRRSGRRGFEGAGRDEAD